MNYSIDIIREKANYISPTSRYASILDYINKFHVVDGLLFGLDTRRTMNTACLRFLCDSFREIFMNEPPEEK